MSKRINNISLPEEKKEEVCEECTVIVEEPEKKKRGRPKKEKEEKPKKPVGRPKSDTDIKTRRLLYGLTFFSKMLGLSDEEIEKKKEELINNIKTGKVDTNSFEIDKPGKDSHKTFDV